MSKEISPLHQVTNRGSNSLAQTQTGDQVSTPYRFAALAPPSFPSRPGRSILMNWRSEGSLTVDNSTHCWTSRDTRSRCQRQLTTFDTVPDDVLLEIFDFYVDGDKDRDIDEYEYAEEQRIEEWIMLTHVCRRWRSIVFQSPRRLNLRLLCTPKTPAKNMDVWPPLPLIIDSFDSLRVGDIVAALEHNDRVCRINLGRLSNVELEYVTNSAAMQEPFPELTHLRLGTSVHSGLAEQILPDSFLGGTAPRLRSLHLGGVSFPRLPKLLFSSTHLVSLVLHNIPRTGYIPPEEMATSLSTLISLEYLRLEFQYPRPRPALDGRSPRPPPLTRSILSSLTKILFKGVSEYLEEILVRIDAPRLDRFHIVFFNQIIFDTPQLLQFVSRSPTLKAPKLGHIAFHSEGIIVKFPSQTSDYDVLSVEIACTASDWQLSSLEQLFTSPSPPFSTLEDLYIFESRRYPPHRQDGVEYALWLGLLRSLAAVKNLYLSRGLATRIEPFLQRLVRRRMTEVLPTLDNIFLHEHWLITNYVNEGIRRFVAARRLTSHPVAVSHWNVRWHPRIFNWLRAERSNYRLKG